MTSAAGRSATPARALTLIAALSVLCPATAQAQAWLPVRGEGMVSVIGQYIGLSGHFDTDGSRLEQCAPSRAWLGITEFEYGVTDKLAFTARLPYVASRYTGGADEPCTAELRQLYEELRTTDPSLRSLDTGAYYSTFQDLGFTIRYNILDRRGVAVTPLIGATIPTHHYRTVGEAAPGQDRLALQTGVDAGVLFDPVIPGGYAHASYAYSFVQPLLGISLNRSNAEFEVGYALTPTVSVRGLAAWQRTHGGLSFADVVDRGFNGEPDVFLDHDRLLANRYWHVGGGTTVVLSDSVALDGAVLTFVAGSESHYGIGATVGVTWKVLSAKRRSP